MSKLKNTKIGILLIGDELLDGRLRDGNAYFLSQEIKSKTNYTLLNILTVRDVELEIVRALDFLADQCKLVICSGGLGPTTDDLTREALAKYFNQELYLDEDVLAKLKERYEKRGRAFDPSNIKQATFPNGSKIIPNPYGTAAAFELSKNEFSVICLPGVPNELKGIWADFILPELLAKNSHLPQKQTQTFRIFGIPESSLNTRVLAAKLNPETLVTYRAHFPDIELQLSSYNSEQLATDINLITQEIGQNIFSNSVDKNLEQVVYELLLAKGLSLACAESCTGGAISAAIVKIAGASKVFKGSIVAYSEIQKQNLLGVDSELLKKHGAVSAECVETMAENVKNLTKSDIGLAISGYAGAGLELALEKEEVGLFYVGLNIMGQKFSEKFFYKDERARFIAYATYAALGFVRGRLLTRGF